MAHVDDLLEPEVGEEARDTLAVAPMPHHVDVAVVPLAEVERLAVETHGKAAEEAQDDALLAGGVDDALGLGDHVRAGCEYELCRHRGVHGPHCPPREALANKRGASRRLGLGAAR